MEIVYRSCTGKIFCNKEECIEYEKTLDFKMYGPDGKTDRTKTSFVVDIKTPKAADDFIKMCATEEFGSDGIKRDCPGVYLWSSSNSKYFLLEPLTFKALKRYIKDIEMQE